MLGHAVQRIDRDRRESPDRCCGDDNAAAGTSEGREGGAQPEEDPVEVHRDEASVGLVGHLDRGAACRDPGVEVHDVEPTVGLFRSRDGCRHGLRVRDVAADEERIELGSQSDTPVDVDIGDRDPAASVTQGADGGSPDPVGPARDKGGRPREVDRPGHC